MAKIKITLEEVASKVVIELQSLTGGITVGKITDIYIYIYNNNGIYVAFLVPEQRSWRGHAR